MNVAQSDPACLRDLRRRYAGIDAFAGVRLVTLGDGSERGVRVLELRSGDGLDAEVVVDRGFDLGRVAIGGTTVSWHAPAGLRGPWLMDAAADRGQGYLRGASGFLTTCGFDHIRQPETDRLDGMPLHPTGEVDFPLHGHGAHQPARLVGYGLDERRDPPALWCEGEVVQATTFGAALRLSRRIAVPLGGMRIGIRDRVANIGPFPSTHMMLYHFNLGYPLIDEGSAVEVGEAEEVWRSGEHEPLAPFSAPSPTHSADLSVHRMSGTAPTAGCRVAGGRAGLAVEIAFDSTTLPFLQLLRMGGYGLYGAGIEPCTTGLRTRRAAREAGQMAVLQSGAHRDYAIDISFSR